VLNLVREVLGRDMLSKSERLLVEAEKILVRMDAHTGRRDPSKRVKK
jgi:hypothetical protein